MSEHHKDDKEIARLHFITYDMPGKSHSQQTREVLAGGCNWVQLRMKEADPQVWKEQAIACLTQCIESQAKLIINDNVQLAYTIGADGVHLGKNDMTPVEAREILGENAIIGGTANSFEDIVWLVEQGVDYIGLGPYKFTSTKKNLSPVLGVEGYCDILRKCAQAGIEMPIVAIGGIVPEDLESVLSVGVKGIAISSYLADREDTASATLEMMTQIGRLTSRLFRKKIKK